MFSKESVGNMNPYKILIQKNKNIAYILKYEVAHKLSIARAT